jgi:hypothetical protein
MTFIKKHLKWIKHGHKFFANCLIKSWDLTGHQWLKPIIPAPQKAEIRRIKV